jgi:septal ring factor EnvC (AmiA/AmiB activator)
MVPSTFSMTIGSDVENGPSKLYVVATGIASLPTDITISGGSNKIAEELAAAELKAKQESDAKAAAELKAKKDAEAKAAADKAAKEKVAADALAQQKPTAVSKPLAKKKLITCMKGTLTKKVSAIKPVCPKGFKKK